MSTVEEADTAVEKFSRFVSCLYLSFFSMLSDLLVVHQGLSFYESMELKRNHRN